jgi:hypothetical protein
VPVRAGGAGTAAQRRTRHHRHDVARRECNTPTFQCDLPPVSCPRSPGGHRLASWCSPSPNPLALALLTRRPFRPPSRLARRSCVPGRGLVPVSRPHIPRPGDRFHIICANFRSPGSQPARS